MMDDIPNKRYFRPDEVAEMLRVSRSYVYWMIREGRLTVVRIGKLIRIPREEYCRMGKNGSQK